jgi:hypothetical protein
VAAVVLSVVVRWEPTLTLVNGTLVARPGQYSSASGSALLGLDGLEVLAARVAAGEWQFEVQTTARWSAVRGLRVRAELHDLPCP